MYRLSGQEVVGIETTGISTTARLQNSNTLEIEQFNVSWLPSLPLTKKHKVPPICGVGILYSEELEKVLHVFETDNLLEGVNRFSRDQAAALNIDPGCRLHWIEITNPVRRALAKIKLQRQIQTA